MTQFTPSRFEVLPTVIKNLLIINVLFFLAENTIGKSGYFNMDDLLALHHIKSPLFQPWQIITHLFLHANLMHLFSNMFALWMFGAVLENLWGPKRFLTFYFLCGIGAALIQLVSLWIGSHELLNQFLFVKQHPSTENIITYYRTFGLDHDQNSVNILQEYLADPDNSNNLNQIITHISNVTYSVINNPTIGASGAVFGILAAFVYLFPNTDIYLYFLFPIKAKWIGLAYFGYEFWSGIQNSAGDNIAHWAHIGGGLVGFLLVLTWNKKNRRKFY